MGGAAMLQANVVRARGQRAQLTVLPVEQVRPTTEAEAEADEDVLPTGGQGASLYR